MQERAGNELQSAADAIASAFVAARREGRALAAFPGIVPATMAAGYAVQERAIARFPDAVVGWKVGAIALAQRERNGEPRLVGPIFRRSLRWAHGGNPIEFPVFDGGFAAVEAEFVFRLASDAPPAKHRYDPDEAADLVASMHVGIETAGSPLATINALGPTVVVSDFGNNAGLILGPAITNWRAQSLDTLTCETFIDDATVGRGSAAAIENGPLAALAFALGHLAARGRPHKAGDCVTTGAVTGIHEIVAGQSAHVVFDGIGTLRCRAVAHGSGA